jgi:molybdopterin synthase sulfur carrier subunit
MAVLVQIPLALQKFTKHQSTVQIEGVTVQEALDDLARHFPEIRAQLCDSRGAIREFINLYLNNEDIRFLEGEKTAVQDGDELAIIPAVAGGHRS